MLQPEDNANVLIVAQEINRYLEQHPQASDTMEGIVQWWLTHQRFEQAWDTVHKALEHLVAKGSVAKHVTIEGKTMYSRQQGTGT